jgi:hypothetical protein
MSRVVLDAEGGQVYAELARGDIAGDVRVHVVVEILDPETLPMAAIAQAGKSFDWLADEPDLYIDSDLIERAR